MTVTAFRLRNDGKLAHLQIKQGGQWRDATELEVHEWCLCVSEGLPLLHLKEVLSKRLKEREAQ